MTILWTHCLWNWFLLRCRSRKGSVGMGICSIGILVMALLMSGCSQLTSLAMRPLPDYWRWKYKAGWHIESPAYSAFTLMALHYISRERLFTSVYGGYAILDGQLVGLHSHENRFSVWVPWVTLENNQLLEISRKTVYNESDLPKDVVGFYIQEGRRIEILANMLPPPYQERLSEGGYPNGEGPCIYLNNLALRPEVQASKLTITTNGEDVKVVDLPLPGYLQASATQQRADGKEFLFILIKERSASRHALIVIDDHFQCLGFYIFPNHLCEPLYFVKNNQGKLFIVPLSALLSPHEGIFEIEF